MKRIFDRKLGKFVDVTKPEPIKPLKGEPGEPGKNADPELIKELVRQAVAEIPAPKDGEDGKSVDPKEVDAIISQKVSEIKIPLPKPGENGRGILAIAKPSDTQIEITYSDGIKQTLELPKAKDSREIELGVSQTHIQWRYVGDVNWINLALIPKPLMGKGGGLSSLQMAKINNTSGVNTGDVTLAGTPNYITIVGQVITRALIDLASHITGRLPFANVTQIATDRILGRISVSTGDVEVLTGGNVATIMGLGDAAFIGTPVSIANGGTSSTDAFDAHIALYNDGTISEELGALDKDQRMLLWNKQPTGAETVFAYNIDTLKSAIQSATITQIIGQINTWSAIQSYTADIKITTAGKGLYIKEGTNATMGVATLVGGTVVVSTTEVTANSRIFLTAQSLGTVTVGQGLAVSARTAGTSFTILSQSALDTSVVAWMIIEPA